MESDNFFQNQTIQGFNPYPHQGFNWNGQNNSTISSGSQCYNNPYLTRNSNIPVRTVFSPEQISPQDIPTNGTPALFPLADGSCIIARRLLPNGLFEERVYTFAPPKNQNENAPQTPTEFDQVMERLGSIESGLKQVLNDLYGSKIQINQQPQEVKNE